MKRTMFLLTVLTIVAMLVAACDGTPTEAPAPTATSAPPTPTSVAIVVEKETPTPAPTPVVSKYNEAPMLKDLVDAGTLPSVEERLPVEPVVVPVVESVGEYGGTWHNLTWWGGAGNIKMILYDPPVRWKPDYTGYEPGLAESYEWSDDGQTITFKFREGTRWSDGEPFTMEDLEFWWEDLAKNTDFGVITVPWWARDSEGNPIEMEFPDDYTWVLHFDSPQWIMPYVLAQGFWEWEWLMAPKHFVQQWHPDYEGSDYEELDLQNRWFETPGYPCLMAWCLKGFEAGQTWLFERNPYYWKVDPEGNLVAFAADSVTHSGHVQ